MKTYLKLIVAVFTMALVFTACNKTKASSKRFIKAGQWNVTELSVDGENQEELPFWVINDCEIYDESCIGSWENDEGGATDFIWQISNKGGTFTISRQGDDLEELEHADEEMATQCFEFSGTYDVIEDGTTKMKLTSSATEGFAGQTAVITLEKN